MAGTLDEHQCVRDLGPPREESIVADPRQLLGERVACKQKPIPHAGETLSEPRSV